MSIATAQGVIDAARNELARRQAATGAPIARFSTIDVLANADSNSIATSASGHLQALVAVLAAGGIVSFLATVLVDDLVILRKRRSAAATGSTNGQVPDEHPSAAAIDTDGADVSQDSINPPPRPEVDSSTRPILTPYARPGHRK